MFEFENVHDILSFAISLEHISREFYLELVDQVSDPAVQIFLEEMAGQEAMHEQQLRSLLEEGDALLLTKVDPKEVAAYIETLHIPNDLDYKKAVKIARDKENASRMLYTILAGLANEKEQRRLFLYLAEQEQKHKEFFEKEYHRICLGEN